MAGGKEDEQQQGQSEKQQQQSQKALSIPVRQGSRSLWPWKKTDTSASFLRAARAGNLDKVLEFLKGDTDINTCNSNGLNALHLASKEGHTRVVSALLEKGANVDSATKKGNTALHIASLAGQEDIVKVLVDSGASVNTQSQNGFTPLYMAAQENHDSVVRFLLANGGNQSLATEDGFTPLAVALQQGHDKVVAVLLENDTRGKVRLPALHIAAKKDDSKAAALLLHTDHNPDVTSKSGFTPLHIAAHYGNENVASLLLQRGADPNFVAKHQITPLHVASKWGKGNMVSLLLDKGANIESKTRDGLTPLHCAARSGHETVVDMLLEKGAPITAKTKNGLAPLHMASQGDHVDAARILLYHKAPVDDVTVDFLTALHVAAHCGHVRVAKLLLDRKADPNSRALNGFTPLHIACKKNRIKVVELLLKHGASIEATTESGLTPLHVASFMGCMNIVIYLLQHGASPDVPTVRGETPLHLAARASQTDIIRILLRNGAQVDARAREQQTALHIASRLGNTDIVVLLLQHGAAVDATTKDHYTPLHIAAKEGQEEVASVLLEHGASLTASTKKGFTPLHLAAKYGNLKVARILLQKEAPVDAQGKNGVTPLHVAAHYDHQNVALLLLDKGASPHAAAKNGYTPLHIAARKNQMDIATTLLEYGASANAESKAGFIPLHLSAQEGHADMSNLLIEHGASCGASARNGLTPLHLCAQEDQVGVAAILAKEGAEIDPTTKAGYTPLHVACHFGQMNMVRFLLQHGAQVDPTTKLGYTPLHQAAQQGHTLIINLLLEHKAEPNMETKDGKTALGIAQRLGYISVVETLKVVTETKVTTNTTTVTEEKYKVVVPESMHETTFLSESEDDGGDDTMLGDQPYHFLTVDAMKSIGDDALPIEDKMDMSFQSSNSAAPLQSLPPDQSPQHPKEASTFIKTHQADNVDFTKPPILAGPESLNTTMNTSMASEEPQIIPCEVLVKQEAAPSLAEQPKEPAPEVPVRIPDAVPATVTEPPEPTADSESVDSSGAVTPTPDVLEGFLVSFMVDARGGAMRGCRHSGVRVIIPPRKAAMPMRITCRYLKKDKLVHAPPLMEGEALSSRILEMGPAGAKFLGPVIIEVPHFASLRGKEREIVILRSDNGETWREHTLEATEEAVQEVLNESFDGEDLKQLEDLNTNRITRILTTDFPQYFAIVTRIRQEVHAIGPEGGMVSSTVVPQVQAVFPQGALTKKIKVGLQAQPISPELVAKLLGNRVAVSPIVTVEPRRRKFHKPITLTIPVPQASSKGMINQYSGEAPTLRLLCSITGGTTRAQWEDVTGSTPLTFVNDCVSFTTTVSARFWLMDCTNIPEATRMATELYREAIHVPFMAKFVVFSKRHQLEEARVRVFCMTDDKEDKTLETQEQFIEVAKSRDVEVLEGKTQYLEFAGNLVPITKSGDQLAFNFYAFRENRLPFTIRVKDQNADPVGKILFMRQPKVGRGDPPQSPICNLNLSLPENVQPEPAPSEPDLLSLEKKYAFLSISKADTIHKADLRLTDISNMLSSDWVLLARELEVSESDINIIKSQYPENAPQQAVVMLRLWMQTSGNKATGNTLEKALRKIGRDDIVQQCIFNVELVTDDIERAMAKAHLDQSGFDSLKRELGPSADTSLQRDASLDVSYDEKDLMKEAESAEEDEASEKEPKEPGKKAPPPKEAGRPPAEDLSPTYEREEKKYAAEEKIFSEEKVLKEESKSATKITEEKILQGERIPKEDIDLLLIEERISKEDRFSKEEKFSSQRKSEERTERKGDEVCIQRKEEESEELEEKLVEQKKEKVEETKIKQSSDANIIETKMQEKEVYEEKVHGEKLHEERLSEERITGAPKTPTPTPDRPKSVDEVIVQEKRTLPTGLEAVDGTSKDKSELLQKLGEELGKLDEKLEEKFREKSKTQQPVYDGTEVEEEEIIGLPKPEKVIATSHIVVESTDEKREATISSPSSEKEPAFVEEPRSPVAAEVEADGYPGHSPEESVHITDDLASPSSEEVADLPRDRSEQEVKSVSDQHPKIEEKEPQDILEETTQVLEVEKEAQDPSESESPRDVHVADVQAEPEFESEIDLGVPQQEVEPVSEKIPKEKTAPEKLTSEVESEGREDPEVQPIPEPTSLPQDLEEEPLLESQEGEEEEMTEKLQEIKEAPSSETSNEQPDTSLLGDDRVAESLNEQSLTATEADLSETPQEAVIEPMILTQPSSEPSSLSTDKEVIFETERELTESAKETVEEQTGRQEPSFESLSSTEIYSPSESIAEVTAQHPALESKSTEEYSQIETLPPVSESYTQESFEQQFSEQSPEMIIVKEITDSSSDAIESDKQDLSSGEFTQEPCPPSDEALQESTEEKEAESDSLTSDKIEESSSQYQDSQLKAEPFKERLPEEEVLVSAEASQDKEPVEIGTSSAEFTQPSAEAKQMVEELPPEPLREDKGAPRSPDVARTEQPSQPPPQHQQAVDACLESLASLCCSEHPADTLPTTKVEDFAVSALSQPASHPKPVDDVKAKKILRRAKTQDAELDPIPPTPPFLPSKSLDAFPKNGMANRDSHRESSENDLLRDFGGDDNVSLDRSVIFTSTTLAPMKDGSVLSGEPMEHPRDHPFQVEPAPVCELPPHDSFLDGKINESSPATHYDQGAFVLEEEVKGLMAEVARAKRLVKEERDAKVLSSPNTAGLPIQLSDLYDPVRDPFQDHRRLPTIAEIAKESEEETLSSADERDALEKPSRPPEVLKPSLDTGQFDETVTKDEISKFPGLSQAHSSHLDAEKRAAFDKPTKKLQPQPVLPKKLGVGRWQRIISKHCHKTHHKLEKAKAHPLDESSNIPKHHRLIVKKDPTSSTNGSSFSSSMNIPYEPRYHSTSTQTLDLHPSVQSTPHLYNHYVTLGNICREVKEMIAVVEESFRKRSQSSLDIRVMIERLDVLKETILKADYGAGSVKNEILCRSTDTVSKSTVSSDLLNNNFVEPYTHPHEAMPVGTGSVHQETALLLLNGQLDDGGEENTDVEEVQSDSETPVKAPPKMHPTPPCDSEAERITDVDDVDASEEDDLETNAVEVGVCALETLSIPVGEVVNLTEGYARHASPMLSDQEGEYEDIQQRHRANILKSSVVVPAEEVAPSFTDSEDLETSEAEDLGNSPNEEENSFVLQEHYELNETVDSHEHVGAKPPMFHKCKKKPASRSLLKKNLLDVHPEEQEDTTELEDLSGDEKRMRQRRKKSKHKSPLSSKDKRKTPPPDSPPEQSQQTEKLPGTLEATDTESLHGTSESDSEDSYDSSQVKKRILAHKIDQEEDVAYSDIDMNEDDAIAPPIMKETPFQIPEPESEQISVREDDVKEEVPTQADTDEEGFEMGEKEDTAPLSLPKRAPHLAHEVPEVRAEEEEEGEDALTDIEDMKIEEKEKDEILKEAIQPFTAEGTKVLLHMETQAIDHHEKPEEKVPPEPREGAIVNIPEESSGTDSEDLEADASIPSRKEPLARISEKPPSHNDTDSEGIEGSDEDIPLLPGKRQLSDIQFIHGDKGLMSIVVSPASTGAAPAEDKVEGVIFLDPEEPGNRTDTEDISETEGNGRNQKMRLDPQDCSTDDELFEASRPDTPLPPENCEAPFLPSPKREKVTISVDKDGSESMALEELPDEEDLPPSELPHTDTDDLDLPEEAVLAMLDPPKRPVPEVLIDFPSVTSLKQRSSAASRRAKRKKAKKDKSPPLNPYMYSSLRPDDKVTLKEFLSAGEEEEDLPPAGESLSSAPNRTKDEVSSDTDVETIETGSEGKGKVCSGGSPASGNQLCHAAAEAESDVAASKPTPTADSRDEVALSEAHREARYPTVSPSSGYNSRSDFASDENLKRISGGSDSPAQRTKSPLAEAELAVIDCMLASQEATVEEMVFNQKMAEDDAKQREEASRAQEDSAKAGDEPPSKNLAKTKPEGKAPPDSSCLARSSSEEGDEQLMMRDSPRWEDEEIQTRETPQSPRPIKAEIKLLVKTTELGKESIEIRSIREFQEAGESQDPSPLPPHTAATRGTEVLLASPEPQSTGRTPSPRFVRTSESPTKHAVVDDEFDLMGQVKESKPEAK